MWLLALECSISDVGETGQGKSLGVSSRDFGPACRAQKVPQKRHKTVAIVRG